MHKTRAETFCHASHNGNTFFSTAEANKRGARNESELVSVNLDKVQVHKKPLGGLRYNYQSG